MTVFEFAKKHDINILCGESDKEFTGCYIGDLLSFVISKASPDYMWITIMSNVNVAAVVTLTEVACITLVDGVTPDNDLRNKAAELDIIILQTSKSAYEIACLVNSENI